MDKDKDIGDSMTEADIVKIENPTDADQNFVKGGDGEIQASYDAQQAQIAHMQYALNGKPVGWGAKGFAAETAAGIDKANEEVRKLFYKGNPDGYRRFLNKKLQKDAAHLEAAAEYERANLAHAMMEDIKNKPELIVTELKDLNNLYVAAHKLNQAATLEKAQTDRSDGANLVTSASMSIGELLDEQSRNAVDGDKDVLQSVKEQILDEQTNGLLKIEQDYASQTENANRQMNDKIWILFRHNQKRLQEAYDDTEKLALANGYGPLAARAAAQSAVRKAAIGVMDSLVESGSYQVYEMWSEQMKRLHMSEIDRDEKGNVKYVSFDAMRKWCLNPEDIAGLDDKFRKKIDYELRLKKAEEKKNDEDALMGIDALETSGRAIAVKGKLDPQEMQNLEAVRTRLSQIVSGGGSSKVTGAALTALKSLDAYREHRESVADAVEKELEKQNKIKSQEEFNREWDVVVNAEKDETAIYALSNNGEVRNGAKGRIVDARVLKMTMIRWAKRNGLCQGQTNDGRGWNEVLAELQKNYGASPEDLAEQSKAYDILKTTIGLTVADEHSAKLIDKSVGNNSGKTKPIEIEWTDTGYNGKIYHHLEKENEVGFKATINGADVLLTGRQMNELMEGAARFQKQHVNAKSEDLAAFMKTALEESVRTAAQKNQWHLFRKNDAWKMPDNLTLGINNAMSFMLRGNDRTTEMQRFISSGNRISSGFVREYELRRMIELRNKQNAGK